MSQRPDTAWTPQLSDLPAGTVTFLFTDIEGSTQLLKRLGDGYQEVMTEHRRLLRAAFEEAGGKEIDTQGDAFFVAFPRAKDAVLASVLAQRALAAHPWPDSVAVKVRMGLHTGEPSVGEEGYLGLAVHRAARICAAGHGGQVLLSQATRALLLDDRAAGIETRDLGEHALKDLDHPERIYQLVVPGLPAEFPPLRTDPEAGAGVQDVLAGAEERGAGRRLRRPAVAASLAAALLVAAAVAAIALSRSGPSGLAGVDANAIGVIDPATNRIVAQVPVGRSPGYVSFGRGSVWAASTKERTVARIDPRARRVTATIAAPSRIAGLAAGPSGAWVLMAGPTVAPIDPAFNTLGTPVSVPTPYVDIARGVGSIALGGGAVWVATGLTTLTRVDAASGRMVGRIVPDTGVSTAIVFDGGSLWLGGEFKLNEVDPAVNRVVASASIPSRYPLALAAGDGRLWVLVRGNKVVKVDPGTASPEATTPVGANAIAIAFGAGAVWVTNSADGTVSRIDSETNRVVATIRTGHSPTGVAFGNGLVWVSVA